MTSQRLPYALPWRALAVAAALLSLLPVAAAQTPRATPVEPQLVRSWLMRIHEAASQRNFQGTLVVTAGGGPVSSARIAHFCEGANQYERIETLDGQPQQTFRVNDLMHTLWPGKQVALIEQRDRVNSFPGLLQAGDDRIADFYELRAEGADRIAGHDATVLTLSARDVHRYGYRLWAEKSTGLLLRADVLGERGELLETAAFSELAIGVKPLPDSVVLPMRRLDGYRVVRMAMQPARLEAEGWSMRLAVPGFRQVSCVKRPMEAAAPGFGASATVIPVLQTIYSDGLTYVSVFIEPDVPQRSMREGLSANGATQTLRSRRVDHWVTVVGDVPPATLKAFADGLSRRK